MFLMKATNMSHRYNCGREWVKDYDSTYWDREALHKSAMFAATRMLDLLAPCDHMRPEEWKTREPMENAVNRLKDANYYDTDCLRQALRIVYKESFATVTHCINQFGTNNMHEWIPTFKEYQDILASAIRYLGGITKKTRQQ